MAKTLTISQRLQTPGLRAKLPDSALTPELLAMRKRQQAQRRADATLYQPGHILSGSDLRGAVNSLVDGQTRPAIDALDRETQVTQAQHDNVAGHALDYFRQWRDRADQDMAAGQGVTDRLMANTRAIDAQRAGAINQAEGAALARQEADGAVRGAGLASYGQGDLAARFAQERADAAARAAADETAFASRGAADERLDVGRGRVADQKGGEAMTELTNKFAGRLGDIAAKRREVSLSRGPLRTDLAMKLRQSGWDQIVAKKGLDMKQQDMILGNQIDQSRLAETQSHNDAMEQASQDRIGVSKDQLAETQRSHRVNENISLGRLKIARGKGSGGLSDAEIARRERNAAKVWNGDKGIQATRNMIDVLVKGAEAKGKKITPQQVKAALTAKGYSDIVVDAAFNMRHNSGRMTFDLIDRLKKEHVPVPVELRLEARESAMPHNKR